MSDVLEWLRGVRAAAKPDWPTHKLSSAAIAEIDRLTRDNEQLRAAIREWHNETVWYGLHKNCFCKFCDTLRRVAQIAEIKGHNCEH